MGKKIAFIALLCAAVICGTWGYFYLQELKKPSLKPLHVLPDNCFALAEIKEPKEFIGQLTRGNLMWEEFLKINDVKKFSKTLLLLDSLTDADDVKDYLGKEPVYIAYYGDGKINSAVYALNLGDVNESQNAINFFIAKFGATKQKNNTYQCLLAAGDEKTTFYVNIEAGLVIASANEALLNDIVNRVNKQTLSENKIFTNAYNTSAKDKGLSLYFHFPHFCKQEWPAFFASSAGEFFTGQSERWFPADVGIEPSELSVKGFLTADSSALYTILKNQETDNFKSLFSVIPYHTTCFESVNISNYGNFVRDNYRGNIDRRHTDLKTYSDSLSADAQTEITKFIGTYAACFEAASNDTVFQYGFLNVSDNEKALVFLRSVCDSVYALNDSVNLFAFSNKDIFRNLTAGFFNREFKFASVNGDGIIFCNSIKGINEYKRTVSPKSNFLGNERAISFIKDNFNTDLNYLFYADVFRTKEKLRMQLSANLNSSLDEAPELYEKFDALAFSLQKMKETIYYTAQAGFNPKYKMYQNTLWEALADTNLYTLPVQVTNHKTGETELVFQDINNNLYLLSNTGKTLWKKHVGEKILGDIRQVDYFANGKLQLMFVTESNIHVIDRNGNYLTGFPVKIKSGASGGISIFDYDNSKNYRLWIPLKNSTVCCLNSACKLVDGFVPVNIKAPLSRPVKQIVVQQKDYFILTDTLGNIYATNRKGEERFKMTNKLPRGNYPLYYDAGKDLSKTYLYYVDLKTKTFCRLSLEDKLEKLPLNTEGTPGQFFFDVSDQATSPLVVLASENRFEAFDFFGKKINDIKSPLDMQPKANCLNFSDKTVYTSLEKSTGMLIMLSAKQKMPNENEIKLSELPGVYNLIAGRPDYLIGYYQNKIFCIKP